MKFGDKCTNVFAGERNPMFHSIFVEYTSSSYKNRFGITHIEKYAVIRGSDGKMYRKVDRKAVREGWLSVEEADRISNDIMNKEQQDE